MTWCKNQINSIWHLILWLLCVYSSQQRNEYILHVCSNSFIIERKVKIDHPLESSSSWWNSRCKIRIDHCNPSSLFVPFEINTQDKSLFTWQGNLRKSFFSEQRDWSKKRASMKEGKHTAEQLIITVFYPLSYRHLFFITMTVIKTCISRLLYDVIIISENHWMEYILHTSNNYV